MSILSGPEIRRQLTIGTIRVSPFDERNLNPASLDLTLGHEVLEVLPRRPGVEIDVKSADLHDHVRFDFSLNSEHPPDLPRGSFQLRPGRLYLMHTVERVATDCFVPVLDGKSSLGRIGVKVHETAGYGDPGFDGQYTLEVTCVYPTCVYAGMRFCQIRFHLLEGEPVLYEGNYRGEASMGPQPSRVWRQFQK